MRKLKIILRNRKGFVVAEMIVAMAMILLITGAAITLMMASIKGDAASMEKYNALTACENAVECVRFTTDRATLQKCLDMVGFDAQNTASEPNVYTFVLESGNDTVIVEVTYDVDGNFEKSIVNYNNETIYVRNK